MLRVVVRSVVGRCSSGLLLAVGVRSQLLSAEQTVVSPSVLSTIVNGVRSLESVVHNHRQLC